MGHWALGIDVSSLPLHPHTLTPLHPFPCHPASLCPLLQHDLVVLDTSNR
ncbi:hypothetical protein [Nostoc sp. CMAA1605]|nr:hypothetical protein [Nostoc sp. CMAA1605]